MRARVRPDMWLMVAATALVGLGACGSGGNGNTVPTPPSNGGRTGSGAGGAKPPTGTGGSATEPTGTGGSVPAGSGGAGGGSAPTGTGGAAPQADAAGTPETGGTVDMPPTPPATGDWMGYPGVADLTVVKKTPGCGMAAMGGGDWMPFDTMVPIPPNHEGPGGDGRRRYFVKLPAGYDANKVYKLVIGGSSCVNQQARPAPIDFAGVTAAAGGVIQISPIVEPGVMQEGSYVCYDDKDTNSIEYGLIEKMLKEVGDKFCYDQNKVFVQGHSSGGWYSNMMGCVYGGTLIRAMSSNGGGLVDEPGVTPPCKSTPTAGMWIHPMSDPEEPAATKRALDRALKVNKCEGGGAAGAWQSAPSEPYTANGAVGCRKYKCPAAFPVVFCQPAGGHGHVSWHAAAAWGFFNSLP